MGPGALIRDDRLQRSLGASGVDHPEQQQRRDDVPGAPSHFGFHAQTNRIYSCPTVSGTTGAHGCGYCDTGTLALVSSSKYWLWASSLASSSPQLKALRVSI